MAQERLGLFDTPPDPREVRLSLGIVGLFFAAFLIILPVRDVRLSEIDAFFTTKTTGTGLGLPLCRGIVEDHGGRLWASQGEPHGAVFHLRLPRSGASAKMDKADDLITSLEDSLRLLRHSKPGLADTVSELQQIVDEVRQSAKQSERQ